MLKNTLTNDEYINTYSTLTHTYCNTAYNTYILQHIHTLHTLYTCFTYITLDTLLFDYESYQMNLQNIDF